MSDSPRPEAEVFCELEKLCTSPGFIHALAWLFFRDGIVGFSDELTAESFLPIFEKERLIRTELATISGLLLKKGVDFSQPSPSLVSEYLEQVERLLHELHSAILAPATTRFREGLTRTDREFDIGQGDFIREAVFYGGDAAHAFQYQDMAVERYREDTEWLKTNQGFSVAEGRRIIQAIERILENRLSAQIAGLRHKPKEEWSILAGFIFTPEEVTKASGLSIETVRNFLNAFSVRSVSQNSQFQSIHDFNVYNARPIIETVDGSFILFGSYSLSESLYESPFYWMHADKAYRPRATTNRGNFTETFALRRMSSVFGTKNTFRGVEIVDRSGDTVGEIDILVVFSNRIIVVQAKSKKLTIEARKGNDNVIQNDFKLGIQDSFDQALKCAQALLEVSSRHLSLRVSGRQISVPLEDLQEIHVFCVVAEHYPALSFQARQFLQAPRTEKILAPFVLDIFTLDVMAEFLSTPLYFLDYSLKRATLDSKVISAHELNILGYHLRRNLWLGNDHDFMMVEDDVSVDMSVSLTVRRTGLPGRSTPDGILTRVKDTWAGRLITEIEKRPNAATLELGFFLLSLNEETLNNISLGVERIVRLSSHDRLHHDITIGVGSAHSGITIHCNTYPDEKARATLLNHCELRKYASHADMWFGICLVPGTGSVRFGVCSKAPWVHNDKLEHATASLGDPRRFGDVRTMKLRKVGRNVPCPCGSGRKYKKCCLMKRP